MKIVVAVLTFGGIALLAIAALQGLMISKGKGFSANFTKSFGLILVATLGAALAGSSASAADKTGAYTLLGTVAGYLAGARTASGANNNAPAPNPNGGGADDTYLL